MMRKHKKLLLVLTMCLVLLGAFHETALAQTFVLLDSFTGQTGLNQNFEFRVDTSDKKKSVPINFRLVGTNPNVQIEGCSTDDTGGCKLKFRSNATGNFNTNIESSGYTTRNLIIRVAATTPPNRAQNNTYNLLAPLPCTTPNEAGCVNGQRTSIDVVGSGGLGKYLNMMLRIFIGVCAILAMAMIVIGGLEYMTSELVSSKESGKHKITGALLGLVLALGSYALLNTINPNLLKVDVNIDQVSLSAGIGGESPGNIVLADKSILREKMGMNCPGSATQNNYRTLLESVATSFLGKVTYSTIPITTPPPPPPPAPNPNVWRSRDPRPSGKDQGVFLIDPPNTPPQTLFIDSTSYLANVYSCSGLNLPWENANAIFSSGQTLGVNSVNSTGSQINGNKDLEVGDLLGWKKEGAEKLGHVVMYVGNGKVIGAETSGIAVRPLLALIDRIVFFKEFTPPANPK